MELNVFLSSWGDSRLSQRKMLFSAHLINSLDDVVGRAKYMPWNIRCNHIQSCFRCCSKSLSSNDRNILVSLKDSDDLDASSSLKIKQITRNTNFQKLHVTMSTLQIDESFSWWLFKGAVATKPKAGRKQAENKPNLIEFLLEYSFILYEDLPGIMKLETCTEKRNFALIYVMISYSEILRNSEFILLLSLRVFQLRVPTRTVS